MALSRRSWIAVGTGALALALLLAWAFAPRPVSVEVAQATVARFETTIDEDARTRLVDRYTVSAPLAGRLARLTLREGDAVTAGQPLAALRPVLSPMLDERTRAEQRARIDAAQANLARAGTRVEAAQVSLELARNELRRTEQLAAQGFVAPTQVERERLALRSADKELEAAAEGRKVARYEVELARAALAAVNRTAVGAGDAPFTVKSPVAGKVLRVHQASEGVVNLGTPLLDLGDTARLEVVAELLTTDALQAAPGSAVRIERWGGPGVLEGRVSRVEPAAFTKISALGVEEQRVNVHIALTSEPAKWQALGDGYRVAVRIVTRSVERALQVPLSAVFPLPGQVEGQVQAMAVFAVEGGRARLRAVTVGARSGGTAWITEGLQAGATVIVYPPAGVEDGGRIEVREM